MCVCEGVVFKGVVYMRVLWVCKGVVCVRMLFV